MKTNSSPEFLTAATFLSMLLLVLIGVLSPVNAFAQQTGKITIQKGFCESIGASNTCNGSPATFPSNVTFTVELGTFNVNTMVFTPTGASPNIDVAIEQNANGSTTTESIFVTDTFVRVCEVVPAGFISIPRPENSSGGSGQFAENNCLIAEIGTGNNQLKFINGPASSTAGEGSISGRVLTPNGRGISKAYLSVVDAETGETRTGLTNAFGYYTIDNLAVGKLYVVRIKHKGYRFTDTTRPVALNDSIADVDFVANP